MLSAIMPFLALGSLAAFFVFLVLYVIAELRRRPKKRKAAGMAVCAVIFSICTASMYSISAAADFLGPGSLAIFFVFLVLHVIAELRRTPGKSSAAGMAVCAVIFFVFTALKFSISDAAVLLWFGSMLAFLFYFFLFAVAGLRGTPRRGKAAGMAGSAAVFLVCLVCTGLMPSDTEEGDAGAGSQPSASVPVPLENSGGSSSARQQESQSAAESEQTPEPESEDEEAVSIPDDSSMTPEDILAVFLHEPFVEQFDIDVRYKSERRRLPGKIVSALKKKPVYLKIAYKTGSDDDDIEIYFSRTREYSAYEDFYYYGTIINNRPNGFGVITKGPVDLDDITDLGSRFVYAGNFRKGVYHGYGASWYTGSEPAGELYRTYDSQTVKDAADIIAGILADEDHRLTASVYQVSGIIYDGHWKRGIMSGRGNAFSFEDDESDMGTMPKLLDGWALGPVYPVSVTVAKDFKLNCANGDTKIYRYGTLSYDGDTVLGINSGKGTSYYENGQKKYKGEWKFGVYHGKGTSYYESGQKEYEGHWTGGVYNGRGKLYDEDGSVIYKGMFEDGDYAS